MFGVHLPRRTSKLSVIMELVRFNLALRRIRIEDIPGMPMMTHKEEICSSELSASVGLPAYASNPNLFAVTVLKNAIKSLNNGLTDVSPFAFMALASIYGSALGNYKKAVALGEMALALHEKIGVKAYACKVYFVFGYMILHWRKSLRECVPYFRKAYEAGLDTGDFLYCGNSINTIAHCRIVTGDNIDDILTDFSRYNDFMEGVQDPFITNLHKVHTLFLQYMKGLRSSPFSLPHEDFDIDDYINEMRGSGNLLNVFLILLTKERSNYLFGQYEEAYRIGYEMDSVMAVPMGAYHVPEHYFYRCLSLLAVYPDKPAPEKRKILGILKQRQAKMKEWAELCPVNYETKYLLIEAERLKATGTFKEAVIRYRDAISSAREYGLTHIEALANERAALLYLSEGIEEVARLYLNAAIQVYAKWGAAAKVMELESSYPSLVERGARDLFDMHTRAAHSHEPSSDTTPILIDISTVMQVFQAISGDIVLDSLIKKIMKMAVVNAGAQRGFLILDTEGTLTIEAVEEDGRESVWDLMQSFPLELCDELCRTIVNYVHRSGVDVILGDALHEGAFTDDPYIMARNCKSILCTPIMSKGKTTGILYMENNLATEAFTPERLELLKMLSAQAAISLENARLFESATTDGLTRLYVHRYFQLLLDKEVSRAQRYNKTVSLIMMDIDNFKKFNDTYGHQMGDEVLRTVARAVKRSLRTIDIAARYGGEEFIVILPETDVPQATTVAEKIRAAVEASEVAHGDEALHVTISLGVAAYPQHAMKKEALIRCADEALYAAKHAGKNRVSIGQASLADTETDMPVS